MATKLGYMVILPWMREELDLKGNELLVYALIHGFSQEAQGCFFGSLEYISKACGCSRGTTIGTLKSLQNKGLIHKRELLENNVKMCQYTAITGGSAKIELPVQKLNGGSAISEPGGSAKIEPNNKTTIDNKKIVKGIPTLSLPFSSQKFIDTWRALCEEKEWKKKTRNALQLALNKLAKYHEDFAIELIEKTIAGGWKGVVFDDTDAKYQEWKSARQQKIDNATPRTAVVNKPRQLPVDNNVDAMYAKLRAKKEAEERELREQLQAQYGDTYRPSGGQDDR
jgi:hypothetical protein